MKIPETLVFGPRVSNRVHPTLPTITVCPDSLLVETKDEFGAVLHSLELNNGFLTPCGISAMHRNVHPARHSPSNFCFSREATIQVQNKVEMEKEGGNDDVIMKHHQRS